MSNYSQIDPDWLAQQFPDLSELHPLATGGQKQVFAARHSTDGQVVLKLMHPGAEPERTERELEAATRIQAPRIPRVFQRGRLAAKVGSLVWFREQRVPGVPLSDRLRAGPLTFPDLLRLALHVSETLVAAEAAKIVHRDVKPANIIVDPESGFWLIDFGLARHLDLDSITATAAPGGWGTIGYAPHEQCRNAKKDIDARADLFALGVTLYEAATGRNPHRDGARDGFEVMARVAKNQLPRLQDPIPSTFADLVSTLAQPNLVHRCRTANEAHQWIMDLCEGEGVQ